MILVGIDTGGSGSRARVVDGRSVLAESTGGPVQLTTMAPAEAVAGLERLIDALPLSGRDVAAVCAGLAGAGAAAARQPVERWAASRFPRAEVRVVRDIDLVLSGRAGIAAVAGTGAVVLARGFDGVEQVVDGAGPLSGDRGGGFWLGREALRAAATDAGRRSALGLLAPDVDLARLDVHRPRDVAGVAGMAKIVCELAEQGDQLAASLVREAAGELASSCRVAEEAIATAAAGLPRRLAGGLWRSPVYLAAFRAQVPHPEAWELTDPLAGAVSMALDLI